MNMDKQQRELDPFVEPAVAWIKHRLEQEQRPVLVACASVMGCDKMGDLLSDVGSVTVILGYMNSEAIEHVLRDHECEGKPTIVVSTIGRVGHGVAFAWPSAYVTSTSTIRVEAAIQLMARPRKALHERKVLAYFPQLLPTNGWLTIADYVDYTIGGNLKQFHFDEQLDKTFSFNYPHD